MLDRILLLIGAHFLADCALQTDRVAYKKNIIFRYMINHVVIYTFIISLFLCFLGIYTHEKSLLILISHYLIDTYLPKYPGFSEDVEKTGIAGWIDQGLHLGFLMGVSLT